MLANLLEFFTSGFALAVGIITGAMLRHLLHRPSKDYADHTERVEVLLAQRNSHILRQNEIFEGISVSLNTMEYNGSETLNILRNK